MRKAILWWLLLVGLAMAEHPLHATEPLVPATASPPATPPSTPAPLPLAGYANGHFFLHDAHDWFVLFPKARLQIDAYTFLNAGNLPAGVDENSSSDLRPKSTIFIRRARIEVQGTIARYFDYSLGGEWASTPETGSYGTVADAFIIANFTPYAEVQVGQFDAPFTLENRTSDKYYDFMERSLTVRAFGIPSNKEDGLMIFGWLPRHFAYYSLGVFNGDGKNFKSQDSNPAFMGRGFISPAAPWAGGHRWLEDIWVGASFWYQKATNLGGAVAPSITGATQNDFPPMTTQGGLCFFSSNYTNGINASGNTVRSHLAANGTIVKWALELNVPIKKVGLRAELVHQSVDLGQYDDTNPAGATIIRTLSGGGRLSGYGYYIEVFAWILGDGNFLDPPGLEPATHIKTFRETPIPKWALMLAAKYDHVNFDVTGLPAQADGTANPGAGGYKIDAFEFGVNAWMMRHIRLTANYVMNYIGGDAVNVTKNAFYLRAEHELLFRVGLAI